MTALLAATRPFHNDDEVSSFCQELFSSLARSDQRKWGEVYVRGLLTVPGRKTIRRISDHIVGGAADQCLQQFVNQSPWRWEPVRRVLAHRAATIRPQAWIVQEAVFPKNGDSSVGVARQYATSAGRVLNCQLGLGVFLASQSGSCVVNWRLQLPKCWDEDHGRRARTRLPDHERYRPRWRHILDAVDELSLGWGVRQAPIVLDACDSDVQPLLRGLIERGLPYLVKVPGHTPVQSGSGRTLTAGELAALSARRRQIILRGYDRPAAIQYSVASICDSCVGQLIPVCPHAGARRVLAEWIPGDRRLNAVWLTNLASARLPELVDLVKLGAQVRHDEMPLLRNDFGLQDFEGRSFAGWHHHVTLVSAAHALRGLGPDLSTVEGRELVSRQA